MNLFLFIIVLNQIVFNSLIFWGLLFVTYDIDTEVLHSGIVLKPKWCYRVGMHRYEKYLSDTDNSLYLKADKSISKFVYTFWEPD